MTIELPRQHYSDFAPSVTGASETASASLDAVDYGNPEAVKKARDAIMHMDVWSSFGDWGLRRGSEEDAVGAFADAVLCGKAASWQHDNPGLKPVEGLSDEHKQKAQATFLSLLSPRGAQAITGKQEVTPDGMRFMPNTGIADLDSLLTAALPHVGTMDRLVPTPAGAFGGGGWGFSSTDDILDNEEWWAGDAHRQGDYALAAGRYEKAAREAESYHKPERAKAEWAKAADEWVLQAWAKNAARQHAEAAEAFEAAARSWAASGHPDEAKDALLKASGQWDLEATAQFSAGHPDLAAQAYEKMAAARTAAGQAEPAKLDWGKAARAWTEEASSARSAGDPASAAAAYEKAAAASEAADSPGEVEAAYGRAAEQWQAAGRPDLAAAAFEKQAAAWMALHHRAMAAEALEKAAAAWEAAGRPDLAAADRRKE